MKDKQDEINKQYEVNKQGIIRKEREIMRLEDLKRKPFKIHKTKDILDHCERSIKEKKPFSLIRFGDACLGMLANQFSKNVDFGKKWGHPCGTTQTNIIFNHLTVPVKDRETVLKRAIQAANNADYIDSYDSDLIGKFPVGKLCFSWKEIHEDIGIINQSYCNTMFHNFINVENEYNIFDLMKGRRIFCVNNLVSKLAPRLREHCKSLDFYHIPGRGKGKGGGHYKSHYKKVCEILRKNALKYDLFLIGAGLLATIYCDVVKTNGGRALDVGSLFHLWRGMKVKSRASRHLTNDNEGLLCRRISKPNKNAEGIW